MAIPISGTDIRLLSGIPFQKDYKHTRWFDNKSQQTTWFSSRNTVYSDSSQSYKFTDQKDTKPNGTVAVRRELDDLLTVNYMMFRNKSKWFYAFVTGVEYVNQQTTWVHFELDVLQTWMFDMNFKPSLVTREHCPLWKSDGSPVINTLDEGLNYGAFYDTVYVENYKPHGNIYFLVIVCKERMDVNATGDNEGVQPNLNGMPQPLTYYVHPFKRDGSQVTITMMGETFDAPSVNNVLRGLYKIEGAQNNIVSLYVTEHLGDSLSVSGSNVTFGESYSPEQVQDKDTSIQLTRVVQLPTYKTIEHLVGYKYNGFREVEESKLLMYPYSLTILDDFKGNRIEIRNEYIAGDNLILLAKGSMGTSQKSSYAVKGYNMNPSNPLSNESSLEYALVNNKPSDVPIITDLLSAYLQGNRNSIATQTDTIHFNGVMNAIQSGSNALASGLKGNVMGALNGVTDVIHGAGNSVLQLQAIESKQKDIDNVPGNIAKQGSDTYYDTGNGYRGVYIIKKQIKPEYIQKLTHYFKMYGYKINEVKIPNFKTRQNWNYVQTLDAVITGNMNDLHTRMLKNIFNAGITLWHTDDIGNYSLANGVRT